MTNIRQYETQCEERKDVKIGCNLCVLNVPPNCSITANTFYIPETIHSNVHGQLGGIKHLTNIPLLLGFFSNDTIKDLRGDTTFEMLPNITIPRFKFYENSVTNKFAVDKKMKLDLAKAVDSIRNDDVIVNSLSESLLLGEIKIGDDFWWSVPGILTESCAAVLILLIIVVVYLTFRIHYLTVTVLVLQKAMKSKADQLVLNYYQQFENEVNMTQFGQKQQTFTILLEVTSQFFPHLIAVLLAITVAVFCLFKLIRKLCKPKVSDELEMALEFRNVESESDDVDNRKPIFVSVLKLFGQIDDYNVKASDFIQSVKITGSYFMPKLGFHWDATVTNQLTGQVSKLEERNSNIICKGKRIKSFYCQIIYYTTCVCERRQDMSH